MNALKIILIGFIVGGVMVEVPRPLVGALGVSGAPGGDEACI
jgi:uncharacterized protein GlcG (DUF336 family)